MQKFVKLLKIKLNSKEAYCGFKYPIFKRKKIIVRTLAMIELTKVHSSENLKTEILKILNDYDIQLSQVLCVTIDIGAN